MQHQPHPVVPVERDFEEVVACSQCAHLVVGLRLEIRQKLGPGAVVRKPGCCCVARLQRTSSVPIVTLADAGRHHPCDTSEQPAQIIGQVVCHEVGQHGCHPAADVDSDASGDDRAARGHD